MFFKILASVLLASGLVWSQSQVSLSGTVKSTRTGAAIEGAIVKLERSSLSALTTTTGTFQINGVTGVSGGRGGSEVRSASPGAPLLHRQLADGPVVIRVLDLAGTRQALLHSGTLPKGDWIVSPPSMAGGMHILSIETPLSSESIKFLGSAGSQGGGALGSRAPAIRNVTGTSLAARLAAVAQDTLVVTHAGYIPARMPLASLLQTGIDILLEDSNNTTVEASTLVPDPSWPCFMPDGIPPPELGTVAFSLTLQIGAIRKVGLTRFGQRLQYDIKGGTATGEGISATVLTGGLDYDLTLENGTREIEQIVILRAGSTPILMRNAGVAAIGSKNARMVLDFEAPNSSSYTWLNTGKFAAVRVVDTVAKTIRMDVYEISKVALPSARVRIKDPAGSENQSWDCPTQTGGQGASVLSEMVTLGSSVSIGASKRGSRNIIPITGGTTTGRVVGKILDGGADYQLGGLDARYTLAPDDGELIIVRNCGPGTLYPVFEARVAGPYNFLNQNKYVSSSPGIVGSGVTITFYEKK